MLEALRSRIKFLVLLGMFVTPICAAVYSSHVNDWAKAHDRISEPLLIENGSESTDNADCASAAPATPIVLADH